MKTTKEKAQEYSKICKFCEEQNFSPRCTSCEFRGKYQGFLAGATEQKKIDIDKAWKWVEEACSKHPITADELSILKQSFKHTMEE